MTDVRILMGDCREVLANLPAGEFHTCVTSPLRGGKWSRPHVDGMLTDTDAVEFPAFGPQPLAPWNAHSVCGPLNGDTSIAVNSAGQVGEKEFVCHGR